LAIVSTGYSVQTTIASPFWKVPLDVKSALADMIFTRVLA
jgi:hypothetical protein